MRTTTARLCVSDIVSSVNTSIIYWSWKVCSSTLCVNDPRIYHIYVCVCVCHCVCTQSTMNPHLAQFYDIRRTYPAEIEKTINFIESGFVKKKKLYIYTQPKKKKKLHIIPSSSVLRIYTYTSWLTHKTCQAPGRGASRSYGLLLL